MTPAPRILIVEDEGIVALDIERQLSGLGYVPVGRTAMAEDAVRMAGQLRPDLVLMDIHLAGSMDGIEAARRIREALSIPSVFLTAYATDEVVERAKTAEPLGYIIKPFDEHNLRTSIEIALHKDVSDRRLRESEARFRLQAAALDAAANAIVITDRYGTIDWVNPAFTAMTGFTIAESIGRNPRDLVRSGAHTSEFYAEMWDTIIAGRVWEGELTNRRKDGTLYLERQTITPVLDDAGRITHFVAIKRDLTEEKRLQAQFLHAQKMEVVGRLSGGIAHDFNNLLTVINGESELALGELGPEDPARGALMAILEAGERAARLTSQLLTFSRKQVISPVVVSVGAQMLALAAMIRRLIGEDIKFHMEIDERAADHVRIDKGQLEQIVLNLAVNARDAMPAGGTLTLAVSRRGESVTVSVSDTGAGIAEDIRSRIFEPFFTTKAQGKGTGLGLATVKDVVDKYGGRIDIESEVGRGSVFIVSLPVCTAPAASASPVEVKAQGTETIVLVEDEPDIRQLAARMLRADGYSVLPMTSSLAALAWFQSNTKPVQLLLTDVVMPDMTGPALAAAVTALRPELPVLFASGYADDKLAPEVIADADRFIAKPYRPAMLAAKVRKILDAAAPR